MVRHIPLAVDLSSFVGVLRSLFQTKHVYLRELIQNALEATHQAVVAGFDPKPIHIKTYPQRGVLEVTDNGIGMTDSELADNLTRLFTSGWPRLEGETLGIGEFGFGFFSSFLVASRVEVLSRPLHLPEMGYKWSLKVGDRSPQIRKMTGSSPPGTTVRLFIDPEHRYLLDDEEIIGEIDACYLYTAYPVKVNGNIVATALPNAWKVQGISTSDRHDVTGWLCERYGLGDLPVAIRSLSVGNGGWLAFVARGDFAPPFEVYRRGILVCREELIPEPYNLFITGLVDMDDVAVKPDRETLYRDGRFNRLIGALTDESRSLTIAAIESTRKRKSSVFVDHYNELMIVLTRDEQIRGSVGLDLPVQVVRAGKSEESWLSVQAILSQQQESCLYWTDDSGRDALLVDRLIHLDKVPVLLQNQVTRDLVLQICREQAIPAYSVARDYSDHVRRGSVDSSDYPELSDLLERALGTGWQVILVRDIDTRLPIRLVIPVEGSERDERRSGQAIVNIENPAIKTFVDYGSSLSLEERQNFVDDICIVARVTLKSDDLLTQVQMANVELLRRHGLVGRDFQKRAADPSGQYSWRYQAISASYGNLLDAVRATVIAYGEGEADHMRFLKEEIVLHPAFIDD